MKRLILTTIFISVLTLLVYSQERPPAMDANFRQLSTSQFYLHLPDSVVWQYKGVTYGWARIARYKDVKEKVGRVTDVSINNRLGVKATVTSPDTTPLIKISIDTTIVRPMLNLYDKAGTQSKVFELIGYSTPQEYGAKGDGVADDTYAIRQCLSQNLNVRLYGDYKITDTLGVREGQKIYSDNATITRTTINSSIFSAYNVNSWQISGKLTLQGSGKANNTAIGLRISGCRKFSVEGLTVIGIPGYGVFVQSGNDVIPRGEGGVISNSWSINNWTGIEFAYGPESEYNSLMHFNATGNKYGVVIGAGNISVTGGNIVDNENGLYIGDLINTNNSHGIISGVNINHNTGYNLHLVNVQYGQTFQGCHFYGSSAQNIEIINSYGVSFSNCIIDGKIENKDGNNPKGFHMFNGCQMEPSVNIVGYKQGVFFQRCFTKEGGLWEGNTVDYIKLNSSEEQTGSIWVSGNSIFGAQVKSDTFLSRSFSSTFSPSNDVTGIFRALPNQVQIASSYNTNGSFQPLTFHTSDLERFRINVNGDASFTNKLSVESSPLSATDVVRKQELDLKQDQLTLTTAGVGGATLSGNVLNIPSFSTVGSSSGQYLPSITGVSGLNSVYSNELWNRWIKVGNVVFVSGSIVMDNDVNTAEKRFFISLPVATSNASIYNGSVSKQVLSGNNSSDMDGCVSGADSKAFFQFNSRNVYGGRYNYNFTYLIQ